MTPLNRFLGITNYIALIITIICTSINSAAQSAVFTPAEQDELVLKGLYVKCEKRYRQTIANLPTENKKDFEEVYKLRWDNIKEKFEKKEIYTASSPQQYINALVDEIIKSNPVLQSQSFNCYFSRSGVPNAAYIGEGIIVFNIGLFLKLENESQAAFVLCHELSHFLLRHSENSIDKYVSAINSKEVQEELRKIKKTEYNKHEQVEKLLKNVTFNTRRHSRDHETEADSLALVLLKKTRFSPTEALTTLAILDSIDIDTFKTDVYLAKIFNSPDYPFKKKWIAKEEGLLGGHAVIEDDEKMHDSLNTHPDCKARIKRLEVMLTKGESGSKNVVDQTTFEELRKTFPFEKIEYAFTADNYTTSLYYTLNLLQIHPSEPYLITMVGKILNACFKAQKEHTLSKYVDLPAPGFKPNYNMLLQFVQNLYADEYASLSYHFLKQYSTRFENYSPFKSAYNTSIEIAKE